MDDLIRRSDAIRIASGYCHWSNIPKELAKLPSVNPIPCEDAISRQAVIKGLTSLAKARAKSDAQKSMMGRAMLFVERLPSVSTEKTGRWIPVSERSPEMYEEIGILKKYVSMRSDEVIVTIRDNKNGSVVTHSECYLWDGKWHGDIFDWLKASKVDYDVIAWQPLPKPYEPQESEDKG